ncbi:galactose-specific lectin nattectin-like [Ctenopharyngodon idella]|uniref:galactose-specific lectin nattectin-like n=1 Tax=Ctenopharyngodon idella TaxID=7959 RepID=UPI00223116B4|nr:galactose-specific lectin nattectin-like [Ctenopharyngodon idella]
MAMLRSVLLFFMIFSMGNAQVDLFRKFTYTYSKRNCQALGANLASVHNKVENDFLLSLLPSSSKQSWGGGHDGEKEGQWLWSDGTAYDYTNWCPGEPNNHRRVENCLEINWFSKSCWNDVACTVSKSYVCSMGL